MNLPFGKAYILNKVFNKDKNTIQVDVNPGGGAAKVTQGASNKEIETKTQSISTADMETITLTQPDSISRRYALLIKNEGAVNVTVQANNVKDEDPFELGDSFTVEAGTNKTQLIEGLFIGDGSTIDVTPASEPSTTFDVIITVIEA